MRLSFNWFHLILLFPCLYFFYWIDNADRNSKIFPIFYYFYWIYISLLALFSLDMTIFSFLFFPFVLNYVSDASTWGVWLLLIVLSLGSDWLDYIFFKNMFRLRRELGESNGGRHWFILFENQIQTTSTSPCRTQVQPAASFLVCSLIFIEYKNFSWLPILKKKNINK